MPETPDQEMVTIPRAEYDSLKADAEWLSCLDAAGVDNWDGASYAHDIRREREAE